MPDETAGLIGDVPIIAESGSAHLDGAIEDGVDVGDEFVELRRTNAANPLKGMKAGHPEGFIDVDVAQARDVFLGKEALFESAAGVAPRGEIGGLNFEGIFSHWSNFARRRLFEGGIEPHATEAARIAETDVFFAGESEDDMGMRKNGGTRRCDVHAAGHAEVEEKGLAVVHDAEEFLTVTVKACEAAASQGGQGFAGRPDKIRPSDGDAADAHAEDVRRKAAADFFDFGQFRHRHSIVAG